MTDSVKIALIGCGGMGARHGLAYAELARAQVRDVQLVAVCDEDGARAALIATNVSAAAGRKVRVYRRLDEVLACGDIDAIDVVLPTWLHHQVAVQGIKAGKHVLVEKPLAITIRAADLVVAAARQSGRVVGVAENIRRIPGNRALRSLIASSELGVPYYMLLQKISLSTELTVAAPGAEQLSAWFNDRRRVGSMEALELGVHEADLLRYWFGDIEEVMAIAQRYSPIPAGLSDPKMATEDTLLANLRFKSGMTGQLAFSSAGHGPDISQRRIQFSDGAVSSGAWFNWDHGAVHYCNGRNVSSSSYTSEYLEALSSEERERLFPDGTFDPHNLVGSNTAPLRFGVAAEIVDFARAVAASRSPEVSLEDGRLAVALAYAFLESAEAGRAIRVADVLSGKERVWQEPIDRELGLTQ
jgi:predicted dehydrogenase